MGCWFGWFLSFGFAYFGFLVGCWRCLFAAFLFVFFAIWLVD